MKILTTHFRRIILSVLAAGWVGLILACGGAGTPSSKPGQTVPVVENKSPYQLVETKTEQTGHGNVMDLYAFAGDFDLAELKMFCGERKDKSPAKVFYYVVIFDNASNAKFPSTPFTAEYGDEENVLKHVRAIYVYNKLNGFSELRYHPQNVWENIPTRENI